MIRLPLTTVAACLLMAGCAQSSFDATAEGARLSQRDADWSKAAFEGKDIEKIVAYWSDDAHVLQPGLQIGRAHV